MPAETVKLVAPDRGDLIWLNFTPQAGHEQAGRRPALVLSPALYNEKAGLCLVVPITSKRKGYPFEVPLPDGLPIQGTVLADQVRSLDWRARKAEVAGKAPAAVLRKVVELVKVLVEG